MIDAGFGSVSMIRTHAKRSLLTSAIGAKESIALSVSAEPLALQPGDVFLMCTDGWWEYVEEPEKLMNHLNDYNERLSLTGGFTTVEADVETILKGLGFTPKDFVRQTDEFSGGWRMRIELAKILLTKSDLLLLDEPTNHLDIESSQWLEDFLEVYPGAVVLISHDKAFLDHVTTRTIEISLGKIYDYKTYYSKYLEQRKERREQQMAAFTNQQKQIADTEKFIERFRSKAWKAVQVQSRVI